MYTCFSLLLNLSFGSKDAIFTCVYETEKNVFPYDVVLITMCSNTCLQSHVNRVQLSLLHLFS